MKTIFESEDRIVRYSLETFEEKVEVDLEVHERLPSGWVVKELTLTKSEFADIASRETVLYQEIKQ